MRISTALRKQINAAVREHSIGANPLAEVGLRDTLLPTGVAWRPNTLLWSDDSDLGDLCRLTSLKEINDDPSNPGCHELDLYITSGSGWARELETNITILIRDGSVVGATAHSLRVQELKAKIAFPVGLGW